MSKQKNVFQNALRRFNNDPEYWEEIFQERAAILQFDGGFTREQAEARARQIVNQMKRDMGEA